MGGLQLSAPNNVTNCFHVKATIRVRKGRLDRGLVVPVTVHNVAPGESSLEVHTGDIELYFRRRLVFLAKYALDANTKILAQTLRQHQR